MEKRIPKSPVIIEKNKIGCVWRLSSIFHSHQGSAKQKLISNKSHGNQALSGAGHARSQALDAESNCINPEKETADKLTDRRLFKRHKKQLEKTRTGDEKNLKLVQMSAKTFIDQMFDGKHLKQDRRSQQNRPFSDALEILRSNKDTFLELLHDPESILIKHIQSLRNVRADEEMIDQRLREDKSFELELFKKSLENSLWKRLKSPCEYNEERPSQHPSNIVVLTPHKRSMQSPVAVDCSCSSSHSRQYLKNKDQIPKPTDSSSRDIRRKLKASSWRDDRNERKKNVARLTDSKSSSRSEVGSSEVNGSRLSSSAVACSSRHESFIVLEAKRHISERLRNTEKCEALTHRQVSRTLERELLSPMHDKLATFSPKWERSCSSISVLMRYPPYNSHEEATENSVETPEQREKIDVLIQMSEPETEILDTDCRSANDLSSSGYEEVMETEIQPEDSSLQKIQLEERSADTTGQESVKLKIPLGNDSSKISPDASPQSKFCICDLETANHNHEVEENQSPVSVLEPFYKANVSSPSSTMSDSDETPIQPRRLDFDEQMERNFLSIMEDMEFVSTYVERQYQDSFLDWDSFLVKFCDAEDWREHNLIYDCIKEVLIDLHRRDFERSPWMSFMNPKILPVLSEENVAKEVLKEVEWYTQPRTMPRTLDQLVGRDVGKAGKWIDIRVDVEAIVINTVETTLEELIIDVVLDFLI